MSKLRLQRSERWGDERICRVYGLTGDEVKVERRLGQRRRGIDKMVYKLWVDGGGG
jgi:hypothetical protein